ncbi:MAG: NADAR family protein [Terriglobales bacterium]
MVVFYRVNDPYGALSNFAQYGFDIDGKRWPTSEHYFQAQKFAGTAHEDEVRLAPTARDAARIGRERRLPLRPDWENVKLDVMRTALHHKFAAHPSLVDLLLSSGDEEIIEQTTEDYYWGCGSDGSGLNMLGKLLMELRAGYRSSSSRP